MNPGLARRAVLPTLPGITFPEGSGQTPQRVRRNDAAQGNRCTVSNRVIGMLLSTHLSRTGNHHIQRFQPDFATFHKESIFLEFISRFLNMDQLISYILWVRI